MIEKDYKKYIGKGSRKKEIYRYPILITLLFSGFYFLEITFEYLCIILCNNSTSGFRVWKITKYGLL